MGTEIGAAGILGCIMRSRRPARLGPSRARRTRATCRAGSRGPTACKGLSGLGRARPCVGPFTQRGREDSDSSGPGERAAEYCTSHGHSANSHEKVAPLEGLRGGTGLEPARGKIEENLRAAKKFDKGPTLGSATVAIFGPAPRKIRKIVQEW